MGSSQQGILTGRMRHGFGQYFMGTGLLFIVASACYRMGEQPVLLGSLATILGWLRSWARRDGRYGDEEFRRFLRRYQRLALRVGKLRAAERIEAEMADRFDSGRSPSRESAAVAACAGAA